MSQRSLLFRGATLSLVATALYLPRVASAQGGMIMSSPTAFSIHSGLPISDDAARTMIEQHLGDVLQAGSESNHVILVVAANGEYVSGKAIKATVIHRVVGDGEQPNVITIRDSAGAAAAGVMVRRVDVTNQGAAGAVVVGAAPTVVMAMTGHGGEAGSAGVMGMGVSAADIDTVGTKSVAAGEWREGAMTVTVIRLK